MLWEEHETLRNLFFFHRCGHLLMLLYMYVLCCCTSTGTDSVRLPESHDTHNGRVIETALDSEGVVDDEDPQEPAYNAWQDLTKELQIYQKFNVRSPFANSVAGSESVLLHGAEDGDASWANMNAVPVDHDLGDWISASNSKHNSIPAFVDSTMASIDDRAMQALPHEYEDWDPKQPADKTLHNFHHRGAWGVFPHAYNGPMSQTPGVHTSNRKTSSHRIWERQSGKKEQQKQVLPWQASSPALAGNDFDLGWGQLEPSPSQKTKGKNSKSNSGLRSSVKSLDPSKYCGSSSTRRASKSSTLTMLDSNPLPPVKDQINKLELKATASNFDLGTPTPLFY